MVGYIHTTDREDYNIITVDFHDRSSHVSMRFDDSIKYTMGALGKLFLSAHSSISELTLLSEI